MSENLNSSKRRVVITGMGMISPLGGNVTDSWSSLIKGDSGISEIDLFDTTNFPCKIAGQIKDIGEEEYSSLNINRGTYLGRKAVSEALKQSGIYRNLELERKCGIIFGNSGYRTKMSEFSEMLKRCSTEKTFETSDINDSETYYKSRYASVVEDISEHFNLGGCSISITTACTSGTQSVGLAYRKIQQGEEDLLLAGGADSMITELDLMGFCLLGAVTNKYNDNPQKGSRPFNRDRSGFVLAEGGATLVLEELSHAQSRNAKIYGEIVGFGNTISAHSILDTPPEGNGLSLAMKKALEDANIKNYEVGYVNAHGTSTKDNDSSEAHSLREIFPLDTCKTLVSSTKASTGHMISAAGTAELIFTLNAVREGIIPATRNLEDIDGICELHHVSECKKRKIEYGMSNSLGFGGSNSSIIIKEFEEYV